MMQQEDESDRYSEEEDNSQQQRPSGASKTGVKAQGVGGAREKHSDSGMEEDYEF